MTARVLDDAWMKRGALVALALLVAAVACGCGEPATPDGGVDGGERGADAATLDSGRVDIPDRVSLERYCELAPTFWCAWLDRCRRGCEAYFEGAGADATGWCSAMAERVADGRVAYDPARATACLRAAQDELDAPCEEGEESRGALNDCVPFEGREAPGEACILPFPIESTCDPALGTCSALPFTERCPGSCVAYAGEAEPCDPTRAGGADCGPGLFCLEGACVRRPGDGEPCGDVPCAEGLRCIPETEALVCRPIRGLGEPCSDPLQCVDGLGCSPEAMECVQTLPRGAACRSSEECAAEDHCSVDGACAPRPTDGEACVEAECAEGLACAFDPAAAELRCQPRASEGEACDPGVCDEGLWCRHAVDGNRCAVVGEVSADCAGDAAWTPRPRCESGAFCNDGGVCEAQRAADEPCDPEALGVPQCDVEAGVICDPFTDSCLGPGRVEGARCLGVCVEGLYCDVDVCQPRIGLGEPCPPGDACVEGAACVDLDGTGLRCWEQTSCTT